MATLPCFVPIHPKSNWQRLFLKKRLKNVCWDLSLGEDFRYPETEGPKPAGIGFINKYISQVHKATLTDEIVCKTFLEVMSFTKSPTALFYPRILWRVIFK